MTKSVLKYHVPLYLYAGVIFYFSSLPHPLPRISIPYFDKFLHIIEYAVFGILAARVFKNSGQGFFRRNFKTLAILLVLAYGASDEFHQLFVACRTFDVLDLTADLAGGIIGAICYGRYQAL